MKLHTDILIIGSGIAGLSAALKLAAHFKVALVTKKEACEANTRYAQGGVASVMSGNDHFDSHVKDTLEAGAGLCHLEVVQKIVSDGPRLIQELVEYGVKFSKRNEQEFDLGQEGGHSQRRILHAGDITGNELERALLDQAKKNTNITFFEHHLAINLITTKKIQPQKDDNTCLGAYVFNSQTNQVITFEAGITLLATGGAGKVYLYTSNPDVATGDGMAMAYRAGAVMANLEFVQFHPTCLYNPGVTLGASKQAPRTFLISEALRGEGALLKRLNGKPFMQDYHPLKDLAPRDIVARAIDLEMKKGGDDFVLLDITHKDPEFIKKRFPNIWAQCLEYGYDLTQTPIPVVPAAHYFCGGIQTNLKGETSLPNLYAVGEVACTGLHGANRLASNSLLEALAMADYAANDIRHKGLPPSTGTAIPEWDIGLATSSDEAVIISQNWDEIRRLMWNYVGIVRTTKRLMRAKRRIALLKEEIREYYWNHTITHDLIELRNLADVAEMIIECALKRHESRGLHATLDYPQTDSLALHDTKIFIP